MAVVYRCSSRYAGSLWLPTAGHIHVHSAVVSSSASSDREL
jgi:hypothetical protein